MSHPQSWGLFSRFWPCLSILHALRRSAQTAGIIEQNFASSLTAVPTENLAVSGAFYVPVYSSVSMSQGKLRARRLEQPPEPAVRERRKPRPDMKFLAVTE